MYASESVETMLRMESGLGEVPNLVRLCQRKKTQRLCTCALDDLSSESERILQAPFE